MQSCIWQHLRASFFHAGSNLICCPGIEEAEHSMELYSAGYRQRWANASMAKTVIYDYYIKQRRAVSYEFYFHMMD